MLFFRILKSNNRLILQHVFRNHHFHQNHLLLREGSVNTDQGEKIRVQLFSVSCLKGRFLKYAYIITDNIFFFWKK